MAYELEYIIGQPLGALGIGGDLALLGKPQNLWTFEEWYEVHARQIENFRAQMPPPSLIDRQMRADMAFKAKSFSQNWLNAMLDVELGLDKITVD